MSIAFPDPSESPWTHPETGLIYEYVDGMWRPQDSSGGGGGNGGGGSGGGGGGGNIGTFSMNSRISHFAPSGLIESCGMAKIGDTIVAAGLPRSWNAYGKPVQKFAVSKDNGQSWVQVDCPIEAYKITSLSEGEDGKFYALAFFVDDSSTTKTILSSSNGYDWTVVNELPKVTRDISGKADDSSHAALTFVGRTLIVTECGATRYTDAWSSTDFGKTFEELRGLSTNGALYITSRLGLPDGSAIINRLNADKEEWYMGDAKLFRPGPEALNPVYCEAEGVITITKSGRILRINDTEIEAAKAANRQYQHDGPSVLAVFRTKNPITSADDYINAEWEKLDCNFGPYSRSRDISLLESVDVNGTNVEVIVYRGLNDNYSLSGRPYYLNEWMTAVSLDEGETWSIVATVSRPSDWAPYGVTHCSTSPVSEFPYWRRQAYPEIDGHQSPNSIYADTGFTLLFDDLKNL